MPPARVGAFLWLLCLQFFVAEQIARMGWTGHYSMRHDFISDLGAASGSSLHCLMNGSFVLQGLLIFFGAMLLHRVLSQDRAGSVGDRGTGSAGGWPGPGRYQRAAASSGRSGSFLRWQSCHDPAGETVEELDCLRGWVRRPAGNPRAGPPRRWFGGGHGGTAGRVSASFIS